MVTQFTPMEAAIGGLLIGLAAVAIMALLGRIAGISGIVGGLLRPAAGDVPWRLTFLAGMLVSPVLYWVVTGDRPEVVIRASWQTIFIGGLLVGIGTRVGSGCTSGHGVCGIARLSPRSLIATAVFIAVGMVTVAVLRHLIGRV